LQEARENGQPFPELYASGVRYEREPQKRERWQLPRETMSARVGDCEDLAAGWRVPELWEQGERAAAVFIKRINPRLRHIMVRRADGTLEDPSARLGMR
jgi:hypothetical protein